jgi:hypothetical protein
LLNVGEKPRLTRHLLFSGARRSTRRTTLYLGNSKARSESRRLPVFGKWR